MSEFNATVTVRVNADSATDASGRIERILTQGREARLFTVATVDLVEPYVAPRTYTQAEVDALVAAARQA